MRIFVCASKHNYEKLPPIISDLEKAGHVITPPNSYNDPFVELRAKKESRQKHVSLKSQFLREQVKKVEENDAVLIVNLDIRNDKNVVGGATFLEMYKAFELGKKIFLFNPIPKGILEDEIIGMNPIVLNGKLELIS